MDISQRLKTISNLIPDCDCVIDVGCDHALLDIYLVKSGKVKKAFAIDINAKALEKAKENVAKLYLNDKVIIKQNNGLKNIQINNKDVVVITGMGCRSIINIIKNHINDINRLVIQSNNEHYQLRKWMHKHDFIIDNEKFIIDKHKAYIIIKFIRGNKKYKKDDYLLGPYLKSDNIFINHQIKLFEKLYYKIPKRFIIKKWQTKRRTKFLKKKCRSFRFDG